MLRDMLGQSLREYRNIFKDFYHHFRLEQNSRLPYEILKLHDNQRKA